MMEKAVQNGELKEFNMLALMIEKMGKLRFLTQS